MMNHHLNIYLYILYIYCTVVLICTTTNCTVYYIICDREEQTQTFYTGVHTLATTLDTLTIQQKYTLKYISRLYVQYDCTHIVMYVYIYIPISIFI